MKHNPRTIIPFVLICSCIMTLGTLVILHNSASAISVDWFVAPDGSGTDCTRASPCSLAYALSIAGANESIILKTGQYTGSGSAVVTITQSIYLLGGWDGIATGSVNKNPDLYPSILDGEKNRRVIYINSGVAPVISGLVIANGWNSLEGGGIYCQYCSLNLTNNVITDNASGNMGGGMLIQYAQAVIVDNQILSNSVPNGGGGLYFGRNTTATVQQNLMQQNNAKYGSTLNIDHATVTATQNVVLENKSNGSIWSSANGTLLAYNNLFAHNQGYAVESISTNGKAKVYHNTFYSNTFGITCGWGGIVTATNNILSDNFWSISCDNITGSNNLFWHNNTNPTQLNNPVYGDPKFIAPASFEFHLGTQSAAIDQGIDAGIETDYDGDRRPIGGGYDIGADERLIFVYLPVVLR